ncbi:MAG: lipopolysaccharide heptosyltransferase I [Burkholderiales bacterium PBB3]|nr:MAG: lipopolysaccharide heptosyltransferase I [Burkholderiales bacterium PBB3]
MRILVVKLSSLGDVVHAMPAVQDLRAAHPDARIDWVVESAFVSLVSRCEGVGRVIACDLRRWRKSPLSSSTRREWGVFKAALRQVRYDVVIDLQGLTKSALVAWLAHTTQTGRRIAMANQTEGSGYEAPTRWVADKAIQLEPHVHAVQRSRLLCAAALGYAVQGPAEFGLRPAAGALSRAVALPVQPSLGSNPFVPRKPVVALVHGTSRADKQWPVSSWVALGQRLNHSGFTVALAHGSAAELATSQAIAAALDDAWVWPPMTLDALVDTMAACAGVVGVDSGLSHIAVALGLPHVQIYNFDTAWRTGPGFDALGDPATAAKQVSVFAAPQPELNAVWQAWESLETPVFCR